LDAVLAYHKYFINSLTLISKKSSKALESNRYGYKKQKDQTHKIKVGTPEFRKLKKSLKEVIKHKKDENYQNRKLIN